MKNIEYLYSVDPEIAAAVDSEFKRQKRNIELIASENIVSENSLENKIKAMVLVDLDGFKHINDTLGHNVGDFAIQSAADKIRNAVEGKGIACRFGGDEFVMLLPLRCKVRLSPLPKDLRRW